MNQKVEYDPKIMDELLAHPSVKVNADQLTTVELEWLKELLVKEGIYAQYVKERESE